MRECELFPPLKEYLKLRGYTVYTEVPLYSRAVDIIAVKGEEHVAIEMKLTLSIGVIRQALKNKYHTHKSYVAVPTRPNKNSIESCKRYGIGILKLCKTEGYDVVLEILDPEMNIPTHIKDFDGWEEGTESGKPCNKGVGISHEVLARIKRYVEKNPHATWDEIYTNVQNHYAHAKSMRGSMYAWFGFTLPKKEKVHAK